MNIIDVGEKLHIIERRQFDNDVKRHFVGEVIRSDNNIIRLRGHA